LRHLRQDLKRSGPVVWKLRIDKLDKQHYLINVTKLQPMNILQIQFQLKGKTEEVMPTSVAFVSD